MEFKLAVLIIKYIFAIGIIWIIWMFPAWLARQNKIAGVQMAQVRFSSWVFGWTGIGWLMGLWWAVKK
ncbi:MAG: hypothetical protein FWG80_03965 [Alphaproteobacteria bacterium]|nr:hypothetical protein [Alphaproteobacteria bacterium]